MIDLVQEHLIGQWNDLLAHVPYFLIRTSGDRIGSLWDEFGLCETGE